MLIDPSTWKREHKLALILAAGLGAIIGAMFGARETAYLADAGPWGVYWIRTAYGMFGAAYVAVLYGAVIVWWAAVGAGIGAVVVCIRQLLRA